MDEKKPRRKYSGFGGDILRIELREKQKPDSDITLKCSKCGNTQTLSDSLNAFQNSGIKVAYFIELSTKSLGKVIRESVEIIALIYKGYYKVRRKYFAKRKFNKNTKQND